MESQLKKSEVPFVCSTFLMCKIVSIELIVLKLVKEIQLKSELFANFFQNMQMWLDKKFYKRFL